jgi:hypothetical protein
MEASQKISTKILTSSDEHLGIISIREIARHVENYKIKNHEKVNEHCLAFNLEKFDEQGNPVEEIPFKIIARDMPGALIKNGDNISIIGHKNEMGIFVPNGVFNISKNSEIEIEKQDLSEQPTLTESNSGEACRSSPGMEHNDINRTQMSSGEHGDFQSIQGIARYVNGYQITGGQGQKNEDYLSFRLERVDDQGNIIEQISVDSYELHRKCRVGASKSLSKEGVLKRNFNT